MKIAPFSIKIEGLKELEGIFKQAPSIVTKQIDKALRLSIALVNRQARIEAPVITGHLRRGIHSKLNPFMGRVESTVWYGVPVHKRNPFMARGAEKSEAKVMLIFQKAVNNITTQLAK